MKYISNMRGVYKIKLGETKNIAVNKLIEIQFLKYNQHHKAADGSANLLKSNIP